LIHDGLQLYYKFLKAAHQSCAAHLIRRCRDLIEVATPTAAQFPLAVKAILEQGLCLRDRYLEQKITLHGLWTATGRLEAKLERLLSRTYQDPANRRFAKHLRHERPYLFTFLYCPGLVDATHNLAERVMRILVMIRKNWGGNRTENGARAQAILTSVLCTARQQDKDVFQLLVELLRSPKPKLLDILPPEIFDANDTKRSPSNDINVGSPKAYRKSSGPDQHIPLPACVEVLLPLMQPSATPEIFSSG
jgi:transposase